MTTEVARAARRREPARRPPARRWPAEWEEHAATWLAWPHAADTWSDRLRAAEGAFAEIVRALQGRERVRLVVGSEAIAERARERLQGEGVDPTVGIEFVAFETDDAWLRDTGALFVVDAGRRIALDFRFDAWGGKYPPWECDDRVAEHMAAHLDVPLERVDVVLEGGSIDGNGAGTVLTTESCLLHPNRGVGHGREELEAMLGERLGARRVLWLGEGIAGDDTDGHVDDFARFVAADVVVAAVEPDPADENHAPLAANLERLRAMRTADDGPLTVIELPMPARQMHRGQRLPASHANFLLANGVALVPVFGGPSDARALAVLRECLPGREVIGIPSRDLVIGLGAVHCLTQQEPA